MINRISYVLIALLLVYSQANAVTFADGEKAYEKRNYKGASTIWEPLAKQGDSASQIRFAGMYTPGLGVERNYETAFDLYHKAAQRRSPEAQNKLGILYATGVGLALDYAAAREWYRKAAEQGYSEAIYNIGISYFKGEGTFTDYVQAHAWIQVAVVKGYESGAPYRDQIADTLPEEKLDQSQEISRRLLIELENNRKLTMS